jgi:hypothetical protein
MELTVVSGLTAFLAVLLSTSWSGITKSTLDLVGRGRLIQEMDMTVASFSHDFAGSLAVPSTSSDLAGEDNGLWVGYRIIGGDTLQLCFDGGANPNGKPDWIPPTDDTIIEYRLEPYVDSHGVSTNRLVRQKLYPEPADDNFIVAKNIDSMTLDDSDPTYLKIALIFKFHCFNGVYTRQLALIARKPL